MPLINGLIVISDLSLQHVKELYTEGVGVEGGGGGAELFKCPYPHKVQAHPPPDQRLATQSRVSGGSIY